MLLFFYARTQMLTFYLIIFTLLGGFIALFLVAGWKSYNDGKLPEKQVLFQWFLAGIVSAGLASYAWLFGAGGDPAKVFQNVLDNLGTKTIVDTLKSTIGGALSSKSESTSSIKNAEATESVASVVTVTPVAPVEKYKEKQIEIIVGMPNF